MSTQLIITALLFLSTNLISQEFAQLNTTWIYESWGLSSGAVFEGRIESDTIIDNNYCTIMSLYVEEEYIPGSEIIFYENDDEVFFYENDEPHLIYDFSQDLKVGDTITYNLPSNVNLYAIASGGPNEGENPFRLRIDSIDFVFTSAGDQLRRFFTDVVYDLNDPNSSCNYMHIIVEDIGTIFNFMVDPCMALPSGFGPNLRCYHSLTKNYELFETCYPVDNTNDTNSDTPISFYPNPFSDFYIIKADKQIRSVQVYTLSGDIILDTKSNLPNLNRLDSGVYILVTNFSDSVASEMIFKM